MRPSTRAKTARPLSASERRRATQLARTRRRATGLLIAATIIFLVSAVLEHRAHWLAWVEATSVASMVGGLADWFAVTALFRHPLGLPIPHTAIVVERKDRFAETLGSFVQESFLTPAAVGERLRGTRALERAARWLADPGHAADVAAHGANALVGAADLLRDEDVHATLNALVRAGFRQVHLSPVAGRALAQLTAEGRLEPVVDAALGAASRYLDDHGPDLHRRLGIRSPWWLPGPVEQRMVHRLIERAQDLLQEMAVNRDHPLRVQLNTGLVKLAEDLQTSPVLRARGEALKAEILAHPEVRSFGADLWADAKRQLREQAGQPGSDLRAWIAGLIVQAGERLRDDPVFAASVERSVDALARVALGRLESDLAGLVSGTIARWDAGETSRRLELLLGPDLQYIRINGTVVGALAGLALHAISVAV